jgi:YVTN family beta-propeller protein
MTQRRLVGMVVALTLLVLATGCWPEQGPGGRPAAIRAQSSSTPARPGAAGTETRAGAGRPPPEAVSRLSALPGMPPPLDPRDLYAADRPGRLSPAVRGFRPLVYVPNSDSGTVDVIDQRRRKVVAHFATGRRPHHVTPSWDLRTLWVDNTEGNTLTPIDPRTGKPGRAVPVADPYNLYFTPDGRYAIVVAEQLRRLDFRDPHSMRLRGSLKVPCMGVDHMDFSANGLYAVVSCEFSSELLKLDIARRRVVRTLGLRPGAMPQDVKLSPDGRVFYVADMASNGVWLVDGERLKMIGFVATGRGAHGLYASRDSRMLYVSNRGEGTISLLSFATRKVVATWHIPGGGSPDMGGVSADGRVLWLSGRYSHEVYAIDTRRGRLLARIPVGAGPHGLCVYPQPGRYSLGHTGVFR